MKKIATIFGDSSSWWSTKLSFQSMLVFHLNSSPRPHIVRESFLFDSHRISTVIQRRMRRPSAYDIASYE